MFPPAGWDVELLLAALRGFLSTPFVTATVAICFTTLFASKVFTFGVSLGSIEND
jgi:hypothetical protein